MCLLSRIAAACGLILAAVSGAGWTAHELERVAIIQLRAAQIGSGHVLLVGDSITEGFSEARLCGEPIINAGIGGATVGQVAPLLPFILYETKPAAVVVLLGVNDAYRTTRTAPEAWAATYDEIIGDILKTGAIPALVTILPIERGKPLGDAAFSSDLIRAYNQKIAQIAAARRASLIDTRPESTGADGFMRRGLSSDGVHPSRDGYALLTRDFERAAGSALNRPCG